MKIKHIKCYEKYEEISPRPAANLEAEGFRDHGGWVVDPQFVEQMGSPYLMAHGMGLPVENASTTIEIPSSGTYHVWARTTDWAPGSWPAPGQFNILLGGKPLPETRGHYVHWGWTYPCANK